MSRKLTTRIAALACVGALALTGCSNNTDNQNTQSAATPPATPAESEAPDQTSEATETESTAQAAEPTVTRQADGTVRMGDIQVRVPEDWTETEADGLSEVWKVGLDNDPNNPTIRLRVAPVYGDTPHPDVAEADLFGLAEVGGLYGDGFKANKRQAQDLKGAKNGFVTDFTYDTNAGDEMTGRWWFLQNPQTNNVTAVEIVGDSDDLNADLLQQINDSLEMVTN